MHLSPYEKRVDTALRQIWGPEPPAFTGSPLASTPLDTAEIILHELAHQVLLPGHIKFTPGEMSLKRLQTDHDAFGTVGAWLDQLRPYQRDLHETRAIAIELLAGKKLRLKLDEKSITRSGWQNTTIKSRAIKFIEIDGTRRGIEVEGFRARVKKATRTNRVIFAAETLYELVRLHIPKGRP